MNKKITFIKTQYREGADYSPDSYGYVFNQNKNSIGSIESRFKSRRNKEIIYKIFPKSPYIETIEDSEYIRKLEFKTFKQAKIFVKRWLTHSIDLAIECFEQRIN